MNVIRNVILSIIGMGLAACQSASTDDLDQRAAESRAVTVEFMQTLKGELQAAIKAGGAGVGSLARMLTLSADPESRFKGELVTAKRAVWSNDIPLAEVKETGRRLGATINDVLPTAAAGAMRGYLERHDQVPDGMKLRAVVPLSREVLSLIASGSSQQANDIVATQLEAPYAMAFTLLQEERDRQLDAVARSDESMARMGDVAQVLLALLIPAGMILVYRELTLRMHRQAELRMRLDAERAR